MDATDAAGAGHGDWRDYLHLDDGALLQQCEFDRFRASGPGGQKRNKTDSAVRLRHRPTGVQGEANESRSQHENRARALRRLRLAIATGCRAPVDLEAYTAPAALTGAVTGGRLAPSPRNPDFAPAVAALFDVLEAAGWRLSEAAPLVGMTTAGLSRAIARDEVVFRAANARRAALGLSLLRPD
ncbi:MAG: peptide chain release factor-like protein [Dehalococcoidia bacterium]